MQLKNIVVQSHNTHNRFTCEPFLFGQDNIACSAYTCFLQSDKRTDIILQQENGKRKVYERI